MQIEDGKLRISVGYSHKTPGAIQYSSNDFHAGISVEMDYAGDLETALAEFATAEVGMAQAVKLAVFGELGLDWEEVKEGVILPATGAKAAPVAPAPVAPVAAPAPSANTYTGGSGGGDGFSPSKYPYAFGAGKGTPAVIDGQNTEIEDLRQIKAANGNPRMPDFKIHRTDGTEKPLWLEYQGKPNQKELTLLRGVGIAV